MANQARLLQNRLYAVRLVVVVAKPTNAKADANALPTDQPQNKDDIAGVKVGGEEESKVDEASVGEG